MSKKIRELVAKAFEASDTAYMARCLEQRNPGPKSLGSTFLTEQSAKSLVEAEWSEYAHEAISSPAQGFKASVPGRLGIVRLEGLDPQQEVTLLDGHNSEDCPEGSGKVSVVVSDVQGPEVDFTCLLIGPAGKEDPTLVVWTFFPGAPINPSELENDALHGSKITVAEAIELGFDWAKITS